MAWSAFHRIAWRILLVLFVVSALIVCQRFLSLSGASAPPVLKHDADSSLSVFLCPPANCTETLHNLIIHNRTWSYVRCALYDLDDETIISDLLSVSRNASVEIVLDEGSPPIRELENAATIRREHGRGLMHNKFCLFSAPDYKLLFTGSYNPTMNARKNWNVIAVSDSEELFSQYLEEFNELSGGTFHGGKPSKMAVVRLNNSIVFARFCPEDECEYWLAKSIESASRSVFFSVFSLTSKRVSAAILDAALRNLSVKGFAEPFQSGRKLVESLQRSGVDVSFLDTPGMLHAKLFIIDSRLIVTGSYNPTASANEINDENLLFIESEELAGNIENLWNKSYSTLTARSYSP
ncbi:hypothetical protein D6764_03725 [Candidatus Woesearchaeota archaeon]|nr:MAG: hypothetical protein D6764_03725 [Candidatus Woesearchaeota archaeon]